MNQLISNVLERTTQPTGMNQRLIGSDLPARANI